MAEAAGAQLVQMEYIQLHPMGDPETGSLNTNPLSGSVKNTIYVNSSGERFTAEDGRRDSICTDALNQEGGHWFWAGENINTYPDETTPQEQLQRHHGGAPRLRPRGERQRLWPNWPGRWGCRRTRFKRLWSPSMRL